MEKKSFIADNESVLKCISPHKTTHIHFCLLSLFSLKYSFKIETGMFCDMLMYMVTCYIQSYNMWYTVLCMWYIVLYTNFYQYVVMSGSGL